MSRHPLVISPAARDDLAEIHRFGNQTWGKAQSREYLGRLKEQLWALTEFPLVGVERHDLLPELRSLPVASHLVFYRLTKGCVEIVRVLHGRQDPHRHLR
ncbi:plasmid stabilization protein [Lamprobacter modestohalophilus]|uniref:Toxin n=1 Tax=Lamprobacter modestohalophilus TaxID=1064514 RepID=A0A9X0WDG7_9GAMM|nr:type II toxin-antitoxin system RelE/ParE family toxin [Lamprobacter modestohalophilus]MBK1621627.1 plasmid stabilization protein [Lamprobacter modestohalophilus]